MFRKDVVVLGATHGCGKVSLLGAAIGTQHACKISNNFKTSRMVLDSHIAGV
jgi:hypothetical protein